MKTRNPDPERMLAAYEDNARHAALSLMIARIDAGMPPDEARESVMRFADRLAAKVRRGVEYGAADMAAEHAEGPRHET